MKVKLKSWVNTHAGTYNLNILIFSRLNGDISAPTTRNYIKLKCPNKHKILMGKVLLFIKLGHKGREREREFGEGSMSKELRSFGGPQDLLLLVTQALFISIFFFLC